jgi:hypothetical protein
MGRIIKWILVFLLILLLVIIGYALLGDLSAPVQEVVKPVTIDVD